MIHKLQKKFILINMSLVALVLALVFTVLCYYNYSRLVWENRRVMQEAIIREGQPQKIKIDGRPKPPPNMTPVFCVLVNRQGEILHLMQENVEVTEEVAKEAALQVLQRGKEEGRLSSLGLRFLVDQGKGEEKGFVKIAFTEDSSIMQNMASLIFTSFLGCVGALAAFFFISLFLSKWALTPVEQAWERQRQFVADASHELKTPVTVILANMGILLTNRKDAIESQIKWVEYTKAEAERMKHLVDDLLFLAKTDAPSVKKPFILLSFSDIVWSALLPFESVAFEQGVALNSEIADGVILEGEEEQLKQLIVILLDNACKYTDEKGAVTVRLEKLPDKVKLSVNNTGQPIAPDSLEHLFERFYRADKARTREKGGYGLGLSIAKRIVEGHHGKITVESTEQEGTTFIVSLPLSKGRRSPQTSASQ